MTGQEQRWTIDKRTTGSSSWPVDCGVVGPDTVPVEVVPARVAGRLTEAAEDVRNAYANSGRPGGMRKLEGALDALNAVVADFRSQHG